MVSESRIEYKEALERESQALDMIQEQRNAERKRVEAAHSSSAATQVEQDLAAVTRQNNELRVELDALKKTSEAQARAAEANLRAAEERATQLAALNGGAAESRGWTMSDNKGPPVPLIDNKELALRTALREVEQLREKLSAVEREAGSLRAKAQSSEKTWMLREQLGEMERRLAQKDAVIAEQARDLAALEQRQHAQTVSNEMLSNEGGAGVAMQHLADLRRDNELLLSRCMKNEASVKRARVALARSEQRVAELEVARDDVETALDEMNAEKVLFERRIANAVAERDSVLRLVETFQAQQQQQQDQSENDAQDGFLRAQLIEATTKIGQLTAQLDAAKQQNEQPSSGDTANNAKRKRVDVDKDVDADAVDNDDDDNDDDDLPPVISTLACAKCRERREQAEAFEAAGGYDMREMVPLHMKMNPLRAAREKLAAQKSGASVTTPMAVRKWSARTPVVPPVTPGDPDKRIQRLKEVFKQKIGEFREAVHILFGYRLDMTEQRCRLLSQYAASPKHALLFELKRNDRGALLLELLDTSYTRTLGKNMTAYLHQFNSIPAFLSNLTLNLFDQQTIQ